MSHFLSGFEELYTSRYTKPARKKGKPPDEQLYFIGRKASPAQPGGAALSTPSSSASPASSRGEPAVHASARNPDVHEVAVDSRRQQTPPAPVTARQPHIKRIGSR